MRQVHFPNFRAKIPNQSSTSKILIILFGCAQVAAKESEIKDFSEQFRVKTSSLQNELDGLVRDLKLKDSVICDQKRLLVDASVAHSSLESTISSWSKLLEQSISELGAQLGSVERVLTDTGPEAVAMVASVSRNSALVSSTAAQLLDLTTTVGVQKEHIGLLDANLQLESSRFAELLEQQRD